VQLCSREFLEIVEAASDDVRLFPVTVTRAALWRFRRRLGLGSYLFYKPDEARARLVMEMATFRPTHIFLNRSELIRLAPLAAELAPLAKIVVMSHGNQSGDDLYEVSGPGGRRASGAARISAAWRLGLDLVTESRFRHRHLHAVCVMSEEEETLERWLGTRRTILLPRIIRADPLDWKPVPGRVGFVGTLNHTPNRIALERLCMRLARVEAPKIEVRLVGGPEDDGHAMARRYSFVRYLGRLDEPALKREVTSWSLFLNPVFWLSRGASMKLGQSLSWAIPALTTRAGARGYRLAPDQVFMTEDSSEAFVADLLRLTQDQNRVAVLRERLVRSAGEWPDAKALGQRLRAAIGEPNHSVT
jgi:hypothetical protein